MTEYTICAAGISRKLGGLVRIYPTKVEMQIHRWDICSVELEKHNMDTREESWKISGSNREWDHLSDKLVKIGRLSKKEQQIALVQDYITPCTQILNEERKSLGLITPINLEPYFQKNSAKSKVTSLPTSLFEYKF
jgi:hypothetical protein